MKLLSVGSLCFALLCVGCSPGPAQRPSGAPATASGGSTPPRFTVDLINLIDLGAHTTRGSAHKNEEGLFTDNMKSETSVMIPVRLPHHYEVEAHVTRQEGNDAFVLGLQIAGQPCQLIIDGWPPQGHLTGLDRLDGKSPGWDGYSGKVHRGQLLPSGQQVKLVCRVRGEQVELLINGQRKFDANIKGHEITWPDTFDIPDPQGMYVGGYGTRHRVSKLELRVLDDTSEKSVVELPDLLSVDQWELAPPVYDPRLGAIHPPQIVLENRNGALVLISPSPQPIMLIHKQDLTRSAVARLKVTMPGTSPGKEPPLRAIGWLPILDRPSPACVAPLPVKQDLDYSASHRILARRLGTHINFAVDGHQLGGRTVEAQYGKVRLAMIVQGPGEVRISTCEILHD